MANNSNSLPHTSYFGLNNKIVAYAKKKLMSFYGLFFFESNLGYFQINFCQSIESRKY